jgi:hypothetical protein
LTPQFLSCHDFAVFWRLLSLLTIISNTAFCPVTQVLGFLPSLGG